MGSKMGIYLYILPLLLYMVSCDHESHHNHYDENRWPAILSKIEFLWKNKTDISSTTTTERTESYDSEGNHWNYQEAEYTTKVSTAVIQNATFIDNVKDGFKASLALMVSVPIVGIILLCCCCYCCCKCCAACCCEDKEEGKIIVLQQNNTQPSNPPPPQTTQVILQQPVYQTPVYGMQPAAPQWGAPPPQQWAAPPHHHHHHHPAAYDNPDYGTPSAQPPQYGQKY